MTLEKLILKRFDSISEASRELDLTRNTIYAAMKANKWSKFTRRRIKSKGYNPDTLEIEWEWTYE